MLLLLDKSRGRALFRYSYEDEYARDDEREAERAARGDVCCRHRAGHLR